MIVTPYWPFNWYDDQFCVFFFFLIKKVRPEIPYLIVLRIYMTSKVLGIVNLATFFFSGGGGGSLKWNLRSAQNSFSQKMLFEWCFQRFCRFQAQSFSFSLDFDNKSLWRFRKGKNLIWRVGRAMWQSNWERKSWKFTLFGFIS